MTGLIYHGDKAARAEIRRKFMPKTTGPDFPLILTSYEMAMSDAKHLAHYKWKYVIVDEVHGETLQLVIILLVFCFSFVFTCLLRWLFPGASAKEFQVFIIKGAKAPANG